MSASFHLECWATFFFSPYSFLAYSEWPFIMVGRKHYNKSQFHDLFFLTIQMMCFRRKSIWIWILLLLSFRLYVNCFLFLLPCPFHCVMTYFEVSNKKKLNRLLFGSWFCLFLANLEKVLTLSITWLSVERKERAYPVFPLSTGSLPGLFQFGGRAADSPIFVVHE